MEKSNKAVRFWYRFYSDFLMPTRLNEFRLLLQEAINHGYETTTIYDFWGKIKNGNINIDKKYFILRHDIDTDIDTAKLMWQIEQELHINGSFYFRLSTLGIPFMQRISEAEGEASYHYEELATVAKWKGLRNKEEIEKALPLIREIFKQNLYLLRAKTGLPMKTVASHGDFINRWLGVVNTVILNDKSFRKDLGIELETYDEKFMHFVSSRFSDTHYPIFWKPSHPLEAIKRGEHVIYFLVHPRHWRSNIKINFLNNLNRVWEGFRYKIKARKKIIK
ncbi:MAG: hypothetical protein IMZ60_02390 [Actinobacteria bacterium]|nr:hypothetical protein [Actinomycetota bacterium]